MFEDQRGRQPYITAVYDKVDAIRFDAYMKTFQALVTGDMNRDQFSEVKIGLVDLAASLSQAALDKMEGLEIIQRPVIVTESPIEKAKELLRVSAIDHTCPLCSGDGVLY